MTDWRSWSRSQVSCRALIAVLPLVALLIAPGHQPRLLVLLVVAGSIAWVVFPELAAGPIVLLSVMASWALVVPDPVQPRVLVAALALSGAHVAGLLAAYGPARVALDRRLVLLWVRRSLLAFVAAPVAYVAVVLLDDPSTQMWPLAWPCWPCWCSSSVCVSGSRRDPRRSRGQ